MFICLFLPLYDQASNDTLYIQVAIFSISFEQTSFSFLLYYTVYMSYLIIFENERLTIHWEYHCCLVEKC